jgi:hypothetical protein
MRSFAPYLHGHCSQNIKIMKMIMKSVMVVFFLAAVMQFAEAKGACFPLAEQNNLSIGGAYATFADKFGGEINKTELMQNSKVGVAGCAEGSLIFTFDLMVHSEGNSEVFSGKSHQLTEDMLKSLRALSKGDSFEFKEVKAQLPTGGKVDVLGRIFTIV